MLDKTDKPYQNDEVCHNAVKFYLVPPIVAVILI